MINLILFFLSFSSVVSQQLLVTGKNNARYNIAGYSSFKSYKSEVKKILSNEIRDTYNFALKYNNTSPSVLLSRTSPEKLLFLQFLHTFDSKNSNFTDFLIYIANKRPFQPSKSFKAYLESNFAFPPITIYNIIKFIANQKLVLPKAVSDLIFFLNVNYEIFEKAAIAGDSEVVRWLLKFGTWDGITIKSSVIEEAWKNGKVEILKLLMEYGKLTDQNFPRSIVNERFENNETMLHLASRLGYADTVNLLITTFGVNIESKDVGKSPLYGAVEENKDSIVKALIDKGANKNNEPLLALAVQKGHIETVKTLVNLDVPFDLKDINGDTPLFIAVKRNNVKILEILVNAKNLNKSLLHSTDNFGDNLLHVAASKGFLESVKSLIQLRIDVNAANNYGETPLHKAVLSENLNVIKVLIEAGADITSQTDFGDTIMHLAALLGNIEIARFLLSRKFGFSMDIMNTVGETPLYKAALSGKCEMLKFLLDNGGNINSTSDGFTMLHTAAAEGNERAVICIIDNGMNVDVNGLWNVTPLNLAVSQGQLRTVIILLSRNANPNAKTKNNWTPLHRAVLNEHLEIIKQLHKYNADISAKNENGLNPLLLAVEKQKSGAIFLLRSLYPDANTLEQ